MPDQMIEAAGTRNARTQAVATNGYRYQSGRLTCDGVDLDRLAGAVGTPCYVYDARGMRERYRGLSAALAPLNPEIRYAVKANPCLAVAKHFADLGAGMDVVSLGELERRADEPHLHRRRRQGR